MSNRLFLSSVGSMLIIVLTALPCLAAPYRLAPDDQIEVKILNQSELTTKQIITPDGLVSLPLIQIQKLDGLTISEAHVSLTKAYSKYIKNPQIIITLDVRPIYVVLHNIEKNTWEIKTAKSIPEARAYAGGNYSGTINHGDIITVSIGKEPNFWEDNWYKVLSGAALAVGIYAAVKR